MKTKARKILQSRINKLRRRLSKKGSLTPLATAQLARLERRLSADREADMQRAAFENAISKEREDFS